MLSLQNHTRSSQSLRQSTKAVKTLALASVSARRPHPQRQTRSFQFGHSSPYPSRNYTKGLLRQHRIMKRNFPTVLPRKLLWSRQISSHPNTYGFKSFMYSALHNRDDRSGARWIKIGQLKTSRQEPTTQGTQTQDWRDLHLCIQRFKANLKASVPVMSDAPAHDPLRSTRMRADLEPEPSLNPRRTTTRSELYHEKLRSQFPTKLSEETSTYSIDPITNRKVYINAPKKEFKEAPAVQKEVPVHTFAMHRSPFFPVTEMKSPPAAAAQIQAVPDSVQEALKGYDAKVAHYNHGALYDVSECKIDVNDAVQSGLKEYDDMIAIKARQLGVHDGPRVANSTSDGIKPQDDLHKTICHYQATSERARELLRAISEYESKRPNFAEGLLKSKSKTHPLIRAIEEFERTKFASGYQSMSDKCIDPLLKTVHEYHEKLRLERTTIEESGCVVDRQLMDVLEPIEEYQRSLSRARYHPKSVDGLKDYDSKVDYSRRRRESILFLEEEEKVEDLDLLRASDIRAAFGKLKKPRVETETEKMRKRKELETAFEVSQKHQNTSAEESTAVDVVKKIRNNSLDKPATPSQQIMASSDASTKGSKGLTGNFVRDFPEEFETTWRSLGSGNLMPRNGSMRIKFESETLGHPSRNHQSKSSDIPRLETSLDRTALNSASKVISPTAFRLETSLDRAAQKLAPTVSQAPSDMPGTVQDKLESAEPTLYKILAYDPTMQSLSQAETTSIVEDLATPLTPADVLLRLSNPAKFFPHFLPLQSQGYEIVSGSGDVLVFRKVRCSGPAKTEQASSTEAHRRAITNPIDGMQRSAHTATGDFASPTGFVNHDLPRGSVPPHNIDVRREEPVFNGKSSWEGSSREKPRRKGRARRVIVSAVWVAGCCYAVGVVLEFFRNGSGGLEGF